MHEMVVSVAEGGIGCKVGDGGVPSCGPRRLTERVGETNRRGVVAGQVRVGHGLIAVILEKKENRSQQFASTGVKTFCIEGAGRFS